MFDTKGQPFYDLSVLGIIISIRFLAQEKQEEQMLNQIIQKNITDMIFLSHSPVTWK